MINFQFLGVVSYLSVSINWKNYVRLLYCVKLHAQFFKKKKIGISSAAKNYNLKNEQENDANNSPKILGKVIKMLRKSIRNLTSLFQPAKMSGESRDRHQIFYVYATKMLR